MRSGPDHRVHDVVNLLLVQLAERVCCFGGEADHRVDLVVSVVFRHFVVRHYCPRVAAGLSRSHVFPTRRETTGP
jgi:hypothetical protein